MRSLRGNQALAQALGQEMERDHRVMLLGEDVAAHGGVFGVSQGLLERFGPQRVIDTPISESGIVGLAVGAAMMGMRPVVEIQFTDLMTIAMDQIVNTAAKVRYAHNGVMHAPVVIRTVNLTKGTIYSSQSLEAWFAHVPGLKVVMPSTPSDAAGLLLTAIRDPDPVIFIESRSLYALRRPVPDQIQAIAFGQSQIIREGSDVTVVAWGPMVSIAKEATEQLSNDGISVELIDPRTLIPFDLNAIVQSVCKTGRLVIVHEAVRRCGFGAEIAAAVMDGEAFGCLQAPIVRVANPGVPVAHSAALHKFALPDTDDVIAGIRRVFEYT